MGAVLYKFVSSETAVANIVAGKLKFAPIFELNDPNELAPFFDWTEVKASLHELRARGFAQEQFVWLQRQSATFDRLAPRARRVPTPRSIADANRMLHDAAYDDEARMHREFEGLVRTIQEGVGVHSFAATYDALPMWAHYAANAKGFVVRFEGMADEFPGDVTGSLNHLKRVQYAPEPQRVTFDPATQDRLFFSKLDAWSYEQEWRVVLALDDCTREVLPANAGDPAGTAKVLHLRSIPPEHVTGVVCGWNVPEKQVRELAAEVSRVNPKAEVLRARLPRGRVELVPV